MRVMTQAAMVAAETLVVTVIGIAVLTFFSWRCSDPRK